MKMLQIHCLNIIRFTVDLVDAPEPGAYPMAAYTYLVIRMDILNDWCNVFVYSYLINDAIYVTMYSNVINITESF